jgi:hypothetical protein
LSKDREVIQILLPVGEPSPTATSYLLILNQPLDRHPCHAPLAGISEKGRASCIGLSHFPPLFATCKNYFAAAYFSLLTYSVQNLAGFASFGEVIVNPAKCPTRAKMFAFAKVHSATTSAASFEIAGHCPAHRQFSVDAGPLVDTLFLSCLSFVRACFENGIRIHE